MTHTKKKKAFCEPEWAVGWAGKGDVEMSPFFCHPMADAHLQALQ